MHSPVGGLSADTIGKNQRFVRIDARSGVLLGELIRDAGVRVVSEGNERAESVRICDVTEDSRTVLPGSLFFAREGLKSDGRRYIGEAVRAGASAVLTDPSVGAGALGRSRAVLLHSEDVARAMAVISERFFGNPSRALKVVGVTGTNGKTTIAYFIHRMLNLCGVRCGMIGTVTIDDGFSVSEAALTTPSATELSHALSKMVEAGCGGAVLEVSSHALDQRRVAGLDFDIGIFTNLSGDHLDYHGTMERYADAKAALFEMLAPDRLAIVNADDPASERMVRDCRARVIRCSLGGDAEWRGEVRRADRDGMAIVLHGGWGTIDAEVSLIGEHNLRNLLQAVCAVHALGVPVAKIAHAVTLLEPAPGRLERVESAEGDPGFGVFVDYAHTDDALEKVLRGVRPFVGEGARLRVVFGCGGDRDRTKRPRMARVACGLADDVIVTSDNPRTESPNAIIEEILAGVPERARGRVSVEADRERAIHHAIEMSGAGDIVVVAGKGHENYQLLPDGLGGIVRRHFDDREVVRGALGARAQRLRETGSGVGAGGIA